MKLGVGDALVKVSGSSSLIVIMVYNHGAKCNLSFAEPAWSIHFCSFQAAIKNKYQDQCTEKKSSVGRLMNRQIGQEVGKERTSFISIAGIHEARVKA